MHNKKFLREIGEKGRLKCSEISHEKRRKNIELYNLSPKLCKNCNSKLDYDKRTQDFCSHSCAASTNNLGNRKHGNPELRKLKLKDYSKTSDYKNKRRSSNIKRNKQKREYLLSHFGKICNICNTPNRLEIHEINGKPHKDFYTMSWKEIIEITTYHKDDYRSICHVCHNHTHWCMKILGMTWKDIQNLLYIRNSK